MQVEKLSREELERLQEGGADPAVATAGGHVPEGLVAEVARAVSEGDFDAAFGVIRNNDDEFYDGVVYSPEFKEMLIGIFGHMAASGDIRGYRAMGSTYSVVNSEDQMDYDRAVEAYELGMKRGDVYCAVEAGYLNYGGYRFQFNYDRAFRCFAYAAIKGGDPEALRGLGELYASTWWGDGSDEMAWDMYQLAVSNAGEGEQGRTYEHLGHMRMKGIPGYVERDPVEALRLYKIAESCYRDYAERGSWRYEQALENLLIFEDDARKKIEEESAHTG